MTAALWVTAIATCILAASVVSAASRYLWNTRKKKRQIERRLDRLFNTIISAVMSSPAGRSLISALVAQIPNWMPEKSLTQVQQEWAQAALEHEKEVRKGQPGWE